MSSIPKVRLFVEAALAAGAEVVAAPAQAHYLRRVMRLGAGGEIAPFNGADGELISSVTVRPIAHGRGQAQID